VQFLRGSASLTRIAVPLVEVDSSYYAKPKPEVAELWAKRTPPDFTFNIKAFRLFTGHQTTPAAPPKDTAEALGSVEKRNLPSPTSDPAITMSAAERSPQRQEKRNM
jgi:uncharacterized protein YecE (DUF72 family)